MIAAADAPRRPVSAALPIVLLLMAAVNLLLAPTLVSLHGEWTDLVNLTFIHGYLIAALAVWLLVRAVNETFTAASPARLALLPLAALSLCWLLAQRAGLELVHQVLWPLVMLFAVCAACGWRNGLRCWLAFAILYCAIPVWGVGDNVLQSLSVFAVKWMLRFTGIATFVEGNLVHIPEGVFEIAEGCNGMHFLIVAVASAAMFGELHRDSFPMRVRQVLLAAALALLTNWIRIYVVVVAGHLTEMQHYLIRVSHYYFGWAVFAVCMSVFFWLVSRAPLSVQPQQAPALVPQALFKRYAAAALLAVAVVGIGPAFKALAPAAAPAVDHAVLPAVDGWQGPTEPHIGWTPRYAGHDRAQLGEYRRAGLAVTAFIAEYDEQRQGKELVVYGNSLLDGLGARVTAESRVQLGNGEAVQLELREGRAGSVVTYFFEIGATRRIHPLAAQLTYGLASLSAPVRSRIVAVRAQCAADCTAAAAAARDWLGTLKLPTSAAE